MRPHLDILSLASTALLAGGLLTGLATEAHAGGIGIVTTGGLHGEPVYFYDGRNNLQQLRQTQIIPQYGAGFDLTLGDRDDRIVGSFRAYWLRDSAQRNPGITSALVSEEDVVAAWRDQAAHVGIASVGVQFGFLGTPDTVQAIVTAHIGSGFLTTDHREFLLAELGGGATWTFAPTLQAFGTLNYTARYRKGFMHGANAYIGVRYLFD